MTCPPNSDFQGDARRACFTITDGDLKKVLPTRAALPLPPDLLEGVRPEVGQELPTLGIFPDRRIRTWVAFILHSQPGQKESHCKGSEVLVTELNYENAAHTM